MPPTSLAQIKPVSSHVQAWRGQGKRHDTAGPMEEQDHMRQQQQQARQPMLQRLVPQRHTGKPPSPVSSDKAEQARKELEKRGQVMPDGQKKRPLPGETAGATQA